MIKWWSNHYRTRSLVPWILAFGPSKFKSAWLLCDPCIAYIYDASVLWKHTNKLRYALMKKLRDYLGKFGNPPPPPPCWEKSQMILYLNESASYGQQFSWIRIMVKLWWSNPDQLIRRGMMMMFQFMHSYYHQRVWWCIHISDDIIVSSWHHRGS